MFVHILCTECHELMISGKNEDGILHRVCPKNGLVDLDLNSGVFTNYFWPIYSRPFHYYSISLINLICYKHFLLYPERQMSGSSIRREIYVLFSNIHKFWRWYVTLMCSRSFCINSIRTEDAPNGMRHILFATGKFSPSFTAMVSPSGNHVGM